MSEKRENGSGTGVGVMSYLQRVMHRILSLVLRPWTMYSTCCTCHIMPCHATRREWNERWYMQAYASFFVSSFRSCIVTGQPDPLSIVHCPASSISPNRSFTNLPMRYATPSWLIDWLLPRLAALPAASHAAATQRAARPRTRTYFRAPRAPPSWSTTTAAAASIRSPRAVKNRNVAPTLSLFALSDRCARAHFLVQMLS